MKIKPWEVRFGVYGFRFWTRRKALKFYYEVRQFLPESVITLQKTPLWTR